MTILPFRLYMHASSTKAYIKLLMQRQAFLTTAMELRQMFLYILHTYMKTTKNWQLCWLVTYFNIRYHSGLIDGYQFHVFWHFRTLFIPLRRSRTLIGMLACIPLL